MKSFDEFLRSGAVRKQTPNKPRAQSLIAEASAKRQFLSVSLRSIPPEEMNYNFVVESCYDIIMELLRAKMFLNGYNAGNSHEAEVSYMAVLGFSFPDVRTMDELRFYRNGIKYYGRMMDKEYAEKILLFMEKVYGEMKKKLG
jgi:hypothetical protein